jgi:hypothetical protein
MIISYLILAHLAGDFLLQPGKLVAWKMRSVWGTLVHVLVHFLTMTLILLPFFLNGHFWLIYVVFGICFIHFWIDQSKINYDLRHDKHVWPFVIDQTLHFLTIIVAYFLIKDYVFALPEGGFFTFYGDIRIFVFLSFLIFLSTVLEVYKFQKARDKGQNPQFDPNKNKMLNRIIAFTLIFGIFVFFGLKSEQMAVFANIFN